MSARHTIAAAQLIRERKFAEAQILVDADDYAGTLRQEHADHAIGAWRTVRETADPELHWEGWLIGAGHLCGATRQKVAS